jgi:hypothetical protein
VTTTPQPESQLYHSRPTPIVQAPTVVVCKYYGNIQ